jgi:predicted aldo/keto reductase-like oxidoreductase
VKEFKQREDSMNRRSFVGSALAAVSAAFAAPRKVKALDVPQKVKAGDIPTTTFGKTGVKVSVIAQGGARMNLHPDVQTAAAHVRRVYDMGVTCFDCSRLYWDGKAEEAYGIGLQGIRKNVFLTTKTIKRMAREAEQELETSLRLLKTDYVDLWQVHAVQNQDDISKILGPGGAMEAFEAAKKAGKCRFVGFTGHYDPEVLVALLKAYEGWDTVFMPLNAVDHAFTCFENTALPVAVERGVGVQAMKVFGNAYLLRSLNPTECLRYALSLPGMHVAVCGAGTQGQMEDNIRAIQNFRKLTPEEMADVRKRALVGPGVSAGPAMEYWKKKA